MLEGYDTAKTFFVVMLLTKRKAMLEGYDTEPF